MPRNIIKILDKDFADMKKGQKMYISSPEEVASYIQGLPCGTIRTPKEMRADLALQAGAEVTCPVSTGIFLRLAIEDVLKMFSIEESPLPFWRVVDEKHAVLKKLGLLPDTIAKMRHLEQSS